MEVKYKIITPEGDSKARVSGLSNMIFLWPLLAGVNNRNGAAILSHFVGDSVRVQALKHPFYIVPYPSCSF